MCLTVYISQFCRAYTSSWRASSVVVIKVPVRGLFVETNRDHHCRWTDDNKEWGANKPAGAYLLLWLGQFRLVVRSLIEWTGTGCTSSKFPHKRSLDHYVVVELKLKGWGCFICLTLCFSEHKRQVGLDFRVEGANCRSVWTRTSDLTESVMGHNLGACAPRILWT